MNDTLVRRLDRFCERVGLGRLPGADSRILGAGYVLAATALSVGVLFVVISSALTVLVADAAPSVAELRFVLAALPFVAVSAFCAAVAVWRVLPDGSPRYGALGGVAATCLTYLLSTVFLFPVVLLVGDGTLSLSVSAAGVYTLLVALYGTILTVWLTLPAGAAAGYLHESVRDYRNS